MNATPAREPVASGTLIETPFAHLALYLYRRNIDGTLVVSTAEHGIEASIRFQQGRAVAGRLGMDAESLVIALTSLCGRREADFTFYAEDLLGDADDLLRGNVDPYALLVASLRDYAQEDMVEAVLERYAGQKLRVQPGRELARLGLGSRDIALVDLIRAAPATPEELVAQSPLGPTRTRHLVYALIVTHMLSLHEDRERETFRSQIEIPVDASPTKAPAPTPPAGRAWKMLASLRPGAPPNAPPITAKSPAERSSIRPAMAPAPRPATSMAPPVKAASESEDPMAQVRSVEQLMEQGRHDEALKKTDKLIAEQSQNADLHALRGQIMFEKHRGDPDGLPRAAVDSLKKALAIDPDQPRALYARGLIYQRGGQPEKALACFKRVLQIQPKHIGAQREVRLARLRGAE